MSQKNTINLLVGIIVILFGFIIVSNSRISGRDLTEEKLESFFRKHTINQNHAVAIKLDFTVPTPGTSYLGTIHGYPNNKSVCEELIAPYNTDPTLSVTPGNRYYCEELSQ